MHDLVENLQQTLFNCQSNLSQIKNILIPFARQPLFERKDGRKNTILCIEDRDEKVAKRYSDIKKATNQIQILLESNLTFFEMLDKLDDPKWLNYTDFIDDIVLNYLYQCVGCR